jgi:hypothetical protein
LARVIFRADRIRAEHQGLHEHFMRMVRFDPEEARIFGDGLPLKNLYGGWAGELFLKQTRIGVGWPWQHPGVGADCGHAFAQGIRRCARFVLLTTPGFSCETS